MSKYQSQRDELGRFLNGSSIKEPINRIMTVLKLRQILEQYPDDMIVFMKNDVGDYSTALTFTVSEDDDLELGVL